MESLFVLSLPKVLFVCSALFMAGFIDSIAGGGGCISLPAYLLTGLPAQTAFACNKVSAVCGTSLASVKYFRSGNMNVKVTLISAAFGLLGSSIGGRIVIALDAAVFQKLIILVMPFAALFLIFKRDFGSEDAFETVPAKKVWLVSILAGLGLGLYDGIIGPGTGTFAIMVFASTLKFDLKTAGGNAKLLNLCTGLGAAFQFIQGGLIIWPLALCTAASNMLGNYIGSSLAIKKGAPFIRVLMVASIVIMLVKLGYDVLV